MSYLDDINQKKELSAEEQKRLELNEAVNSSGDKVTEAVQGGTKELSGSLHNLLMATIVSKDPKIAEVAKRLVKLSDEISKSTKNIQDTNFKPLSDGLKALDATLGDIPSQLEEAFQTNDPTPALEKIAERLGAQKLSPNITVKAPPVDLSPVEKLITGVEEALKGFKVEIPETDFSDLIDETRAVRKAISSLSFPVPNYVLPFKNTQGAATQVQLNSSGEVPVSATLTPAALQDVNLTKVGGTTFALGQQLAASSLPTVLTAAQLSTLTPLSSVTANAGTNLNTSALALESGGNLASIKTNTDKIPSLGQALAASSVPIVLTAAQLSTLTPPAAITGFATASNQTDKSQFTKVTDGTDTLLVTASGEANVLETNSAAIKTSVELIDNAISGAGFNITQLNGATVPMGHGTAATAVRVELPTDGTGVIATVGAVTAITNALPAGTNAIGKLAANSGVDIGDVDVTSMPQPTPPSTLLAFITTVTTAGTRVQLASNAANAGIIQAPSTNTGIVYVGGSDVSSTVYGSELQPGQSAGIAISNTNKLYVDSATNGDKLAFFGS